MEASSLVSLAIVVIGLEELIMMPVIIGFLYAGKGDSWSIDIRLLLVIYVFTKAFLFALKMLLFFFLNSSRKIVWIVTIFTHIPWIIGMAAYYIMAMVYFFEQDEDCMDNAKIYWFGLLIIIIEGFIFFAFIIIFPIFLCILSLKTYVKKREENSQNE